MALKQKGNDFQTFLFSFNTLLAQVREADQQTGSRDMNENEAITYFVKGLPPPTQSSILMKHPRTLKDAIQIATDHEQVYLHARLGQSSNSSSHVTMDLDQVDDDYGEYDESEDDNDANNVAGMRFHRKRRFNAYNGGERQYRTVKQKKSYTPNDKRISNIAGSSSFPRHVVRMQSRNAPQFQMKAQKERNESFGKSTTECCYKCGRPGHYARNCYKFIKKREQRDFHSAERGEDADQDYNQGNE